jgi:hypothetical protein
MHVTDYMTQTTLGTAENDASQTTQTPYKAFYLEYSVSHRRRRKAWRPNGKVGTNIGQRYKQIILPVLGI